MEAVRENIYNTWLKAMAIANKRPYRIRKDFDGLSDVDAAALEKLERIFSAFPGINKLDYFMASYNAKENDFVGGKAFISLSDFCKPKAIRIYNDSVISDPGLDDREMMRRTLEGFRYIANSCKEKHIKLAQYIADDSAAGFVMYPWITDYLGNKITKYNIISFSLIGFDTESAVRKCITESEDTELFGRGFRESVMGGMDKMTKEQKDILVQLLKRTKKSVDSFLGV